MKTQVFYNGWYAFDNRFISFNEVDHQHISNAIWFNEVFNNRTILNDNFMAQVDEVLSKRFHGVRLPWKPLPIPTEIETLIKMGLINANGDIVFRGEVIGTINHIENDSQTN